MAGRLQPFGVRVLGVKQSPWTSEIHYNGVEKRGSWSQLHAFAAEADIVILTCTQTAATRGMVDAAFLAACKPGVVIINVARGTLPTHRNGRPCCQLLLLFSVRLVASGAVSEEGSSPQAGCWTMMP